MKEHKVLPRLQFNFYDADHSGKEALNDLFLRFLLGQAERAQLQNLFARDFADSGFVNQRRIGVVGAELGEASTRAPPSIIASHSAWLSNTSLVARPVSRSVAREFHAQRRFSC